MGQSPSSNEGYFAVVFRRERSTYHARRRGLIQWGPSVVHGLVGPGRGAALHRGRGHGGTWHKSAVGGDDASRGGLGRSAPCGTGGWGDRGMARGAGEWGCEAYSAAPYPVWPPVQNVMGPSGASLDRAHRPASERRAGPSGETLIPCTSRCGSGAIARGRGRLMSDFRRR